MKISLTDIAIRHSKGTVGRTGNVPTLADSHLHYETIQNGVPVNPSGLVNPQNCG